MLYSSVLRESQWPSIEMLMPGVAIKIALRLFNSVIDSGRSLYLSVSK